MAEYVDDSMLDVELIVKVTIDYEDYYLSPEAAKKLGDELNAILNRM